MELMVMVQARETVVLVCYVLPMGNAEVGLEYDTATNGYKK